MGLFMQFSLGFQCSEEVNASTARRKRAFVRVQNVASSWLLPLARRETLQRAEIMDWEAPRALFQ